MSHTTFFLPISTDQQSLDELLFVCMWNLFLHNVIKVHAFPLSFYVLFVKSFFWAQKFHLGFYSTLEITTTG